MRYFTLQKFNWFALIIAVTFSQFIQPPMLVDAQGCTSAIVSYQIYNVDAGGNWVASGVFGQVDVCSALVCQPGQGLILVRPQSGAEFWHCGGGGLPDPPPNYPGIYAGSACQAGSSRTVSITPTGDTHDIQISPSNQIVALGGNSYTFTNLQQGVSYQFRARAENSGGSSGWSSWTGGVQQDLTAPTTTLDLVGTAGLNNWWQSAVSVSLPATDSGCLGVSNTHYTLDGVANTYTGSAFNIPDEGTHTLTYYSTDGSYTETAQNTIILIDTAVPSLTLSPDRSPDGSAGWWIAPVSVSLSASDSASGINSLESNLNSAGWTNYINPITFSVDGTYNLDGRAIDVSGWETVDGLVLPIDSTPPTVGFTFSRPPDHNGWYTGAVDVGVSSSDATSGLASTIARVRSEGTWQAYTGVYTLNSDGQHIFEAIATDIASNATTQEVTVPIDFTAPYLDFVFSREPDRNGWYNNSVHVALQAGDATSGIARVQARLVYEGIWRDYEGAYLIGGDGEHIFEAEVTDDAGHSINRQTLVPIDIVAPETTLMWDGQVLDFTVTDNRSGVMGTTLTINGVVTEYTGIPITFEFAGDYRIEVYSTDMAGNDEAVQVLNISYDPDTETVLVPLSSPTLSADMTCSDEGYEVTGFASASAGLSSIYLLSNDALVTGGRYDYSPASSETEAFAFSYSVSEGDSPNLSVVALADDGSERRLSLSCPAEPILLAPLGFASDEFFNKLLLINPPDDVPTTNPETSVAETNNDSLNQYPISLGDRSTVLEEVAVAPNDIQEPLPASAQQASSNTNSGSSDAQSPYVPPQVIDTTVTLLEPSSPELTYVTSKTSSLSAEELAKILAATGLLATATAGVGLQVTETARRRKEELEAEYIAEQARLDKERLAQAERDRENAEMNAQMRDNAKRQVFIEVQQSEANKRYNEHVAALWAEYHTNMGIKQRFNALNQINEQLEPMIDQINNTIDNYGNFINTSENETLQLVLQQLNEAQANLDIENVIEHANTLISKYQVIVANVAKRHNANVAKKPRETTAQQVQSDDNISARARSGAVLSDGLPTILQNDESLQPSITTPNSQWLESLFTNPIETLSAMGKGILLDIFYDTELSAEEGHESGFTDWRAWTPEMINDVFETNFQNGEYLLDTTLNTLGLSDYILPSSNPHEAFTNNVGPVEIQLTNLDNETYIVSAYPVRNEQGELIHLIQYDPNNQTNSSSINQYELTTAYGEILDMRSLYQGSQQFLRNGEELLQQLHNVQTPTINQAQEAFVNSYAWGVSGYEPHDNPLDVQQMQLFEQVLPGVMTQSNMVTYTLDNSEVFLTPAVQSMLAEASNPDQAYWDFVRMSGQTLSHFQLTGATYFDENDLIQARTTESHPMTPEMEVWLSNAGGENGAHQRLMTIFDRNGAQCQACEEGDLFEIALEATTLLQAEAILAWQEDQQREIPGPNSDIQLIGSIISTIGAHTWDWLNGDPQFAKDMQWIQELQDGMIDRPRPYNDMGALLATLGIPDEPTAREYLEQGLIELGYYEPTWWDTLTTEELAEEYQEHFNEYAYNNYYDPSNYIDDVDAFLATLQPQDEIRARQILEDRLAEFTGISENPEWDAMSTLGLADLYYNLISDELDNPDSELIHEDLLLYWNQMAGIEMESADLGWVGMALEITGSILFEPVDYVLTTRDIISDITNGEVDTWTFVSAIGYLPLVSGAAVNAVEMASDFARYVPEGMLFSEWGQIFNNLDSLPQWAHDWLRQVDFDPHLAIFLSSLDDTQKARLQVIIGEIDDAEGISFGRLAEYLPPAQLNQTIAGLSDDVLEIIARNPRFFDTYDPVRTLPLDEYGAEVAMRYTVADEFGEAVVITYNSYTDMYLAQRAQFLANVDLPENLVNSTVPGSIDLSLSHITQPGGEGTLIYVNGRPAISPGGFDPPGIAGPRNGNPAYELGVYYTPEGFPDFSPYSVVNVRITGMTGSTSLTSGSDFHQASTAAGLITEDGIVYIPDGYTWHHHQDGTTMMLVPTEVNTPRDGGWSHTGGRPVVNPR